jgi:hypothetical protein
MIKPKANKKKPILLVWQSLAICVVIVIFPWVIYSKYQSSIKRFFIPFKERDLHNLINGLNPETADSNRIDRNVVDIDVIPGSKIKTQTEVLNGEDANISTTKKAIVNDLPVLGPVPTEGNCFRYQS